jgi:23S rRNA (cytidine1920-2'-O)/16S rRNA (cytidine1409-2'-O)-methyltransferase
MGRKRPLVELASAALAPLTREQVIARIVCGDVLVGGERVREPRRSVDEDARITLAASPRFVSRAGLKLEHAVSLWHLPVRGKTFIDAGCSTGGFTDCLLQGGALRVYAVDVGLNQLDYALRRDARVVARERTNVASLTAADFDVQPNAAVADLSFRSLRIAAAHLLSLVSDGWIVALAKPQFEWRQPRGGFDGVVRDPRVVAEVLTALVRDLWAEGACLSRAVVAPVRGRRGNVEVLLDLRSRAPGGLDAAEGRLREALDELVS